VAFWAGGARGPGGWRSGPAGGGLGRRVAFWAGGWRFGPAGGGLGRRVGGLAGWAVPAVSGVCGLGLGVVGGALSG